MSETKCPRPEKVPHRTFKAAMAARDGLESAKGLDLGLRPYRCECGRWHLGHKFKDPKWFKRGKR